MTDNLFRRPLSPGEIAEALDSLRKMPEGDVFPFLVSQWDEIREEESQMLRNPIAERQAECSHPEEERNTRQGRVASQVEECKLCSKITKVTR